MESWFEKLSWFESKEYQEVLEYLDAEEQTGKRVLPSPENILNAYTTTPLEQVKVVILGQDPYPTPGHAHGLAFSVLPDVRPLPRTLQNIFTELELDYGAVPENGCLEGWARQGVFLLNTSLTVRAGDPGSHSNIGWIGLVNETIKLINKETDHTVFILWGKKAQSKMTYISRRKHSIIYGPHPSPLSANKGFFGSRPFTRANEYLIEHGKEPIDWSASWNDC